MQRRQELLLRLLGVVGFVLALFLLPTVGRRCGLSVPVTPLPVPGLPTYTPPPGSTPGESPLSNPLSSPLPTPTVAPTPTPARVGTAPVYGYRVVRSYPHDPEAFTQGLVYVDGVLYEGTGLRGRSSLRRVDLESGAVLQFYALPDQFFGEGITVLGDRLYQLTWQSHKGFVYDRQSFALLAEFAYPTEGWGLTHDGTHLIMSDGTATLHFLDPADLREVRQVEVRDAKGPVWWLNELEYVEGEVYANIWRTDRIARIDPESGRVVGWIHLYELLPREGLTQRVDVLNGVAYDAEGDRLWVTGKLWPTLYEIELVLPPTE